MQNVTSNELIAHHLRAIPVVNLVDDNTADPNYERSLAQGLYEAHAFYHYQSAQRGACLFCDEEQNKDHEIREMRMKIEELEAEINQLKEDNSRTQQNKREIGHRMLFGMHPALAAAALGILMVAHISALRLIRG
ncbi:hypothetical protein QBC43DRAFT_293116 [Cladorrhinum sp. PSN259]|nr:hypothetical protein QBC43DRAFT_293116 [Cladorrhinum sp. PSN259]